jgi:hypothetical protein
MNALSTITSAPCTWEEITSFVHKVKEEILSGEYNPLAIEISLKAMEETIKCLREDKEIRQQVLDEAAKYDKNFEFNGVKMQVREAGVKYDYASSGDSEWAILDAQVKELTEKRKAREKYLCSLPFEGAVSAVTGEFLTPPAKTSTTTIVITLK